MNKVQRETLIELIRQMINEHETGDVEDTLMRLEAEKEFHEAFANESEKEDNHNHVSRT
jgi:hypothetical protein